MKNKILLVLLTLFLLSVISLSVWYLLNRSEKGKFETTTQEEDTDTSLSLEEDLIYKDETVEAPNWVPNNISGGNPWFQDLYMATSEDGLTFEDDKLFLPHAGVGHLLLTEGEELIATFQYFSYVYEDMFDKIAYSISEDFGETWSPVKLVNIGMPNVVQGGKSNMNINPVDPTLMQLEDGTFRLYFTYEQPEDGYPQLYSASSSSIDGYFKWEGKQLTTESIILDPAVIYFDNTWHHYTTNHSQFDQDTTDNVHSTSKTGIDFEREDDIPLEMGFLGDVIEVEGGIRFYGGQDSAFSEDGFDWTMDEGQRLNGADPGVTLLPDGSYIAIYTGGGN